MVSMGEVINLRKWRRAKDKSEAEAQAAANRSSFGRTRAEKTRDEEAEVRRRALLDQAKLRED